MDINTGLTQVLADGTHTYLYGRGRIAQEGAAVVYFFGDALSSVRQLVDGSAAVTLTQSYEPYGSVLGSVGSGESVFHYTGEARDSSGLIFLRTRYYDSQNGRFLSRDIWSGDIFRPASQNSWNYVEGNPVIFVDPSGRVCLDPWAPAGIHFIPDLGCDYPEGSKGILWWWRDPLGPDTSVIDMPWVDEQSQDMWNRYPNSCGAAALYMFLHGEGINADFDNLVQQLQSTRPGGYDGYCCHNSVGDAAGLTPLPSVTPNPDPLGWCNKACVSAAALANVARSYYGLDIVAGDGRTHEEVYERVRDGHPVLVLIRFGMTTNQFGHFVVIRGFVDGGWTVVFNDSYPGEEYWDSNGGSATQRQEIGEARMVDWRTFDASWASSVDSGYDPLAPDGHVRWGMYVK